LLTPPPDLDGATIVFDLDGTLADTAPDLIGTLNMLLVGEGLPPVTLDEAKTLIGRGARALLTQGFAVGGKPLAEPRLSELFDDFLTHYRAHIADLSRLFPGVVEALDVLGTHGARLAVCTNKPTDLSLALLEALGVASRFAAVVGRDSAPAAKPDPRHLIFAIERAGGRADWAVMVGDSAADADAARAAAVPLILVDFGYTDIPASELKPDILISHFHQLPAACVRLLGAGAEAIGRCPAPDA
jgi:phosphoglycolate phosphatase